MESPIERMAERARKRERERERERERSGVSEIPPILYIMYI
jgi:hypothetical protein